MARTLNPRARDCVSQAEAARRVGVSKEAIRQAIKRGALQVVTLGPKLNLIPLSSLETYNPSPNQIGPRSRHQ